MVNNNGDDDPVVGIEPNNNYITYLISPKSTYKN